jgi:hypothetical protein
MPAIDRRCADIDHPARRSSEPARPATAETVDRDASPFGIRNKSFVAPLTRIADAGCYT